MHASPNNLQRAVACGLLVAGLAACGGLESASAPSVTEPTATAQLSFAAAGAGGLDLDLGGYVSGTYSGKAANYVGSTPYGSVCLSAIDRCVQLDGAGAQSLGGLCPGSWAWNGETGYPRLFNRYTSSGGAAGTACGGTQVASACTWNTKPTYLLPGQPTAAALTCTIDDANLNIDVGVTGAGGSAPTVVALPSGAGGGLIGYITTSGSYNGGLWGGTHTFASSGALTQFADCCDSSHTVTGGATTDFGADGLIAWGRWSSGSTGGGASLRTMPYVAKLDANNPSATSSVGTFPPFASSAPTIVSGSTLVATGASNAVTGSVTTNLGNLQGSGGSVLYQLNIPVGGVTFTVSGTAAQFAGSAFLGTSSTITAAGGGGTACSPSCAGIIPWSDAAMGFLTGRNGERIGLNYAFSSSLGLVTGVVVFK